MSEKKQKKEAAEDPGAYDIVSPGNFSAQNLTATAIPVGSLLLAAGLAYKGVDSVFDKIRNNITCVIAMSNASKEMQQMFFYNVKEDMRNDKTRGMGHVLLDGCRLKHIVVPRITNMDKMNLYVKRLLNRDNSSEEA